MTGKTKPPAADADNGKLDNNKRLAFLEAGVSSLATAIAAGGSPVAEGKDPIEVAVRIVTDYPAVHKGFVDAAVEAKASADRIAELEQQLATATGKIDRLAETIIASGLDGPQEGEGPIDTAIRLLTAKDAEPKDIDADVEAALSKQITALEAHVSNLEEDLAKAQAAAAAAGKKMAAAPKPKARSVKARKVCAGNRDVKTKEAIEAAMASGAPLEIVISDGKNEIIDFEPLEVTGAAFARSSRGWSLTKGFQVKGSGGEHRIRGFGLFFDGRQIAFAALPQADVIAPGVIRAYQSQVVF